MDRKNRKKLLIISAAVAAAVIVGTTIAKGQNTEADESATLRLREYTAEVGDLTAGIDAEGRLFATKVAHYFDTAVPIGKLYVETGDSVRKGDRIADISEDVMDKKLSELKDNLKKAEIVLEEANNAKSLFIMNAQKTQQNTADESFAAYAQKIIPLQNKKDDLQIQKSQADAALQDVNKQISEQKNQGIPETAPGFIELEAKKKELEDQITSLDTQLAATESAIAEQNTQRDNAVQLQEKNASFNRKTDTLQIDNLNNAIETAQLNVDALRKQVDSLQTQMESKTLFAQIDGVVMSVGYKTGEEAIPNVPVAQIGNTSKMTATIWVDENDIGNITEGQTIEFNVTAFQDEPVGGKVVSRELIPDAQDTEGRYKVYASIDPNDYELLEGMTCSVKFIVKQIQGVLTLSNKAIILKDGKQFVQMKNEDGSLRELEITTGFSDGRSSEVTSGLSAGDIVVKEG